LSEFERAPIGAYSQLFALGNFGNVYNYWYVLRNAVADDMANSPIYGDALDYGWYRDTENNKNATNELFGVGFRALASVNDALQFVEERDGNPYPTISADDRTYNLDRLTGELYFLRGFIYYMEATVFCTPYAPGGANDERQIPLRTTRPSTDDNAVNPQQGSVHEKWTQIQSDFLQAYALLPERFVDGKMHASYQAGRANKFAAAAMLARTAFAMGNYAEAREYATFVIERNGGDYDLSEDPIEAFNKSIPSCGREVIMWIPCYDKTFGRQNLHAALFNHSAGGAPIGWSAFHMDYGTLRRIGWMDDARNDTTINFAARRDKRFQQLIYVREPYDVPAEERIPDRYYETRSHLTYRTVVADKLNRGPEAGYTNYPQIRLAEMYLTRSICAFKAGDKQSAADDLNVVRKRAWDEAVAGQAYESSSHYVTAAGITEDMIHDERLIELFAEGDRLDYLRGLKMDIGPGIREEAPLPYDSKKFVWSVPINEQNLNEAYQ
jgi:hypothetical protein